MSGDRDIAYVAAEPIPPSKPPKPASGVIHWLRSNLFNGALDSLLTLISVALILWLVPPLIDWAILKGVWNAHSLDECRQIVTTAHGEGARGACWAVLNGRIGLFLFGFYPPELYWRPTLALALLPMAMAPILVRSLPRRLLWLSAIFPVIAVILIWGGFGLEPVRSSKIGGLLLMITIAVAGIATAIPFGCLLAIGRQSPAIAVRAICAAVAAFFRGVPLIVLLIAASILFLFVLPRGTDFHLFARIAMVLGLASGVYMADAIVRGIASLPRSQWETAAALGLSYRKAFFLIILPQALKRAMPRIVCVSAGLFRDISIVSMIGLIDPLGLLNPLRANANWNGILWELFAAVILLYWVFSFAITRYSIYLDRRLKAEVHDPVNAR